MPVKPKQWPLSIYLLKKEVTDVDAALRSNLAVRRVAIRQGRGTIGTFFHRTTASRAPRWVSFLGTHVDPREMQSSSVAAVLIVRAADRLFALTFGMGRHLLSADSFEEDFGLRVTLNSVSPDRVRTIDRMALDATGRHSREQASRSIPIIEFGLDIDKDILRAVTGPPEDTSLGSRLTGADALAAIVETRLEDLRSQLERYLVQFRKRIYRRGFPWVDNIREIGDPRLRAELDLKLEERIRGRRLDRIWMAVPDLVDWHDVAGFAFSRAGNLLDDIGFDSYLDYVRRADEVDVATLHRHRVFCISAETDSAKSEWPVYDCIYAELDRNQRTYLLNGGRWYEVARDYVREVDRALSHIPQSASLRLPAFTDSDRNEGEYNRRVSESAPTTFALMDRRMIRYGGGSSQIEFCDLYTRNRQIVHVKRYGGSGTLSHLFAQGSVSANLFVNDQRFRTAVNSVLPESHKLRSATGALRASDYEVAYVVASKASGPLILPFFSRVTLRSAATQLRNMGYGVSLTKVECT